MKYDFTIYTDYDGTVRSGSVPKRRRAENSMYRVTWTRNNIERDITKTCPVMDTQAEYSWARCKSGEARIQPGLYKLWEGTCRTTATTIDTFIRSE